MARLRSYGAYGWIVRDDVRCEAQQMMRPCDQPGIAQSIGNLETFLAQGARCRGIIFKVRDASHGVQHPRHCPLVVHLACDRQAFRQQRAGAGRVALEVGQPART